MTQKPNKLQPAIIGGLVLGILSSIPFVNFANICCCIWVVLGGMIAARMLIKRSPVLAVTSGEGAVVGALAGVVGALITLVIGLPVSLLIGDSISIGMLEWFAGVVNDPQARDEIIKVIEETRRQAEMQSIGQRLVGSLFFWFIGAVVTVGFATVGGILGVALFEKRKNQPAPPAPPAPGWNQPPGTPGLAPPSPPPGPMPPPDQPPYGGGEPPRH